MKAIITGAAGFVGRQLTQQLLQSGVKKLSLLDTSFPENYLQDNPVVCCVFGELQDKNIRARLLDDEFDVIFHLAAVPGGAAESNPALSRLVNLDATLALLEEAASASECPRVVYTSTIAVLGAPMPDQVNDLSPIVPAMTYGAHKAMIELALADMSRRGLVDSVSVRLPGIVARPAAASGMKSAFLSNVFHALKAGENFVSPVSPRATMWLMSVPQCASNLIHGSQMDSCNMPASRVVTLPVIRCSMAELVETIAAETSQSPDLVVYQPDEELEAHFGAQPPITTEAAENAGFRNDGSLSELVRRALLSI